MRRRTDGGLIEDGDNTASCMGCLADIGCSALGCSGVLILLVSLVLGAVAMESQERHKISVMVSSVSRLPGCFGVDTDIKRPR